MELVDGNDYYELSCDNYVDSHTGTYESDISENVVEVGFSYSVSGYGWGAGGGRYMSTFDIVNIHKGLQAIRNGKSKKFSYICKFPFKKWNSTYFHWIIINGVNGNYNSYLQITDDLDTVDFWCRISPEQMDSIISDWENYMIEFPVRTGKKMIDFTQKIINQEPNKNECFCDMQKTVLEGLQNFANKKSDEHINSFITDLKEDLSRFGKGEIPTSSYSFTINLETDSECKYVHFYFSPYSNDDDSYYWIYLHEGIYPVGQNRRNERSIWTRGFYANGYADCYMESELGMFKDIISLLNEADVKLTVAKNEKELLHKA